MIGGDAGAVRDSSDFNTCEHESGGGGGAGAQGLRRAQLLQRHPSSWELEPGDQTPPELATSRRPHETPHETPHEAAHEAESLHDSGFQQTLTRPDQVLESTPHQKKTARVPNLPRLRRIESEADPLDREKRGSVTEQSFTLPIEQIKETDEKLNVTNEASQIFNRIVLNLNRDSFLNKVLNPDQKSSFPSEDDQSKDDRSSRTSQITSPESSSGEKDLNPRIWISKSVSKILEDTSKTTTVREKKRSKSPSGLFEFAQRRLPKWASFIKKSDEDVDKSTETLYQPKDAKYSSNPKLVNSKSIDKTAKIANKQRTSEEDEIEIRRKGIIRRVAIEDDSERIEPERYSIAGPSREPQKSPESGESRALKSYSFSFFKGKDKKEVKSDVKIKSKLVDSASLKSKDSEKSEASTPIVSVEPSDNWRKRSTRDLKQTSFDEKPKSITKQKSKDYSGGEPVRKNSINFGNLREKYNRWSKSRNDGGKAASAETLEAAMGQREGYVQGEFLAASMRIFLVVSPPASRTQVRSRSLNNLDALEDKNPRLMESRFRTKMFYNTKSSTPGFFTSMPELTALNFTKGLPYKPGVTHGKSAFVRRNTAKLKHTNSQGSSRDYFRLSLPSSFEFSESIEEQTTDLKKLKQNSIFVPAVGNTSLRDAAQWALECEKLKQNQITSDYSIRMDGSSHYLQMESVDVGQLGGRHVVLQETRKLRNIFRKSSFGLKSLESGKASSPAGSSKSFQDPKTPLALKLQKWSSIFGSKADVMSMERLTVRLEQMNTSRPKLPPSHRTFTLHTQAAALLAEVVKQTKLEDYTSAELPETKEIRRQRVIFELVTTEASFITHMRTLTDLFLAVALALQKENIMTDVDTDKIFSNLIDILNVNLKFWNDTIFPMLTIGVSELNCFNVHFLYDTFHNFGEVFQPYTEYVESQARSSLYTRHLMETNPIYTAYLTWCESQKECKRLKLSDLLVKPMQRLTKYSLLLKAMQNHTDLEPDVTTMKRVIISVNKYISSIDCKIRYVAELDDMDALIETIESYDAIADAKDEDVEKVLRHHCNINLKAKIPYYEPRYHRTVLLQGDIKFKDNRDPKCEVRGILLSDMFLVCSAGSKKKKSQAIRVIRPKILMDRVFMYPHYYIKDGVKELAHIVGIVVDETDVAISYFVMYDLNNPKDPNNAPLKAWLFAMRESQQCLILLRKIIKAPEEGFKDLDSDTQSESDVGEKKEKSTSQEVLLEPMEAIQPAINKAARKRVRTMVYGANLPIDQYPPEGVEVREDYTFSKPCSSRASRMSSLHQSYSGSYDTYEAGTSAHPSGTRAGSADTSTDHRTISMSSDEGQPPLLVTDTGPSVPVVVETPVAKVIVSPRARSAHRPPIVSLPRVACITPTPNTLSVQTSHQNLGQSMPDLASGQLSPAQCSLANSPSKVCLNVPSRKTYLKPNNAGWTGSKSAEKLSPESRGTSYPPSSPTRLGRLTRSVVRSVRRATSAARKDERTWSKYTPIISYDDVKSFQLKASHVQLPSTISTIISNVTASLRRGMAFSNTIKNPPLIKSRNISRDNSPCLTPSPNKMANIGKVPPPSPVAGHSSSSLVDSQHLSIPTSSAEASGSSLSLSSSTDV